MRPWKPRGPDQELYLHPLPPISHIPHHFLPLIHHIALKYRFPSQVAVPEGHINSNDIHQYGHIKQELCYLRQPVKSEDEFEIPCPQLKNVCVCVCVRVCV